MSAVADQPLCRATSRRQLRSESLHLLLEISGESDGSALGARWVQELANRGEHGGDGLIVRRELLLDAGLEIIEPPGQLFVGREQLAQLHKGAHDVDAHLHGLSAVEDVRGLDGIVLGKGVGLIAAAAPT